MLIFPVETLGGRVPLKPWVGQTLVGYIIYTPPTPIHSKYPQPELRTVPNWNSRQRHTSYCSSKSFSLQLTDNSREFFTTYVAHDVNFAALTQQILVSVSRVPIWNQWRPLIAYPLCCQRTVVTSHRYSTLEKRTVVTGHSARRE